MQLFFSEISESQVGSIISLNQEESMHCAKVLRLKSGDKINCTNGKGLVFECTLINSMPKDCTATVDKIIRKEKPQNYYNHIAMAMTKQTDRFEWFLEKAIEIGVQEITPLICEHSERTKINMERLNKIALSACKQSLHITFPKVNNPVLFNDLIENCNEEQKFIAFIDDDSPLIKDIFKPNKKSIIIIGPEGDFSKNEMTKATEKGFKSVSLGNYRLRTETAGVVACTLANWFNS